jgi:hypothetical protein
MIRFGFAALTLAVGLSAAPRLGAQTRSTALVCRDGSVMRTTNTNACVLHGGIDQGATSQASRGVYGTTNGTTGNRGVYSGAGTNGSNRGVYNGAGTNGANRGIYNDGNSRVDRSQSISERERWERIREQNKERARREREERKNDRRDAKHDRQDSKHDRDSDHDRRDSDRYQRSSGTRR